MDNTYYGTLVTVVLALVGVVTLAIASVAITLKGKGDRVVSWRGFGVQFEIRPCAGCAAAKQFFKEK